MRNLCLRDGQRTRTKEQGWEGAVGKIKLGQQCERNQGRKNFKDNVRSIVPNRSQ